MKKRVIAMLVMFVLGISTLGCRMPFADNRKCDAVEAMLNQMLEACKEGDYDKTVTFFANEEDRNKIGTQKELTALKRQFKKEQGKEALRYIEEYTNICKTFVVNEKVEVVYVNSNDQAVVHFYIIDQTPFLTALTVESEKVMQEALLTNANSVYSLLTKAAQTSQNQINPENKGVQVVPVQVKEVDGELKIAELNEELQETLLNYGLGMEKMMIKEITKK